MFLSQLEGRQNGSITKNLKKKGKQTFFFSFLFSNHFSILVYPPLVV